MVRRDGPADRRADRVWQIVPPPEVEIVQRIGTVPDVAPDDLAGSVVRVVDPEGRVVDWRLVDPLAGAPRFWTWRRGWERRRPLGSVRDLASLREVARTVGHGEPGPLDRLLGQLCEVGDDAPPPAPSGAELSVRGFAEAVDELRDVQIALEVTGGTGIAIVDRRRPRGATDAASEPVRAIASGATEFVLAATTVTSLVVDPTGALGVRVRMGATEARIDRIAEVDLTTDPAMVTSVGGEVLTMAPVDARPLAWLAPSSPRWEVRPIPLVDVWRRVFEVVPEIARSVGDGSVVATTRVPVG